MKLSIRKKLSLSFGIILLVMTISGVNTYMSVLDNEKIQDQVVNLRIKTVLLGKDVTNGINKSLAALRGYMILGKDPQKSGQMKAVRLDAWKEIDVALSDLDKMAVNWTVPANVQRLRDLKLELTNFREAQQQIEDIAITNDNIPAYKLLLDEAAPRAKKMLSHVTAIIEEESSLPATSERKELLKNLADIRGSFAIGLANIRAYLLSGNEDFRNQFNAKWQMNVQKVNAINASQLALLTASQNQHWQNFTTIRSEFSKLPAQMFELRGATDWNLANHWLGTKAAPRAAKILTLLAEMKTSQESLLADDLIISKNVTQSLKSTLVGMTLLSLIIGIVCAVVFSQDLLNRLAKILSRATDIAEGDMTGKPLPIKGNDELADLTSAINKMSGSLQSLVQVSADSLKEAAKGTDKILVANQEIATGISDQRTQITQIATAIEELSNSSAEVSRSCMDASENSTGALALAKTGGEIMQESLTQMASIKNAFGRSNTAITTLSEQNKQIEGILSVIKGIADQTNLLALNAAIEAARAGEQGRGFAVVADEVRQLAGRTTEATTEVETAIEAMRRETENAVIIMAEGAKLVDSGVEMSNVASSSLTDIITSVDDVVAKIQSIAATAEEQTMVAAEIAKNTENVSVVSQQVQVGVNNVVNLSDTVKQDTSNKSNELLAMI